MKIAIATLKSLSPYSQSRKHDTPKEDKEGHDAYERRTWRNRMHVMPDGHVFIPPMAFKFAVETAARFLRMRIPGKDKSEYGKHFKAGVIVPEAPVLPDIAAKVEGEWLSLHANGKRGSGSRVQRCMPCIPSWEADVTFYVLDDTITEEVFAIHLREAGNFIGIGRFRPENGGYYGRFEVKKIQWG
jgi:hypothetical protein